MEFTGLHGTKYQLESQPLVSGGEGSIYQVQGDEKKLAKIYHADSLTPDLEKLLLLMLVLQKKVTSPSYWLLLAIIVFLVLLGCVAYSVR